MLKYSYFNFLHWVRFFTEKFQRKKIIYFFKKFYSRKSYNGIYIYIYVYIITGVYLDFMKFSNNVSNYLIQNVNVYRYIKKKKKKESTCQNDIREKF